MAMNEIPLTADNQKFSYAVNGTTYQFGIIWREVCWMLSISDSSGNLIAGELPLVTGVDLMAQHSYLGLDFSLLVLCDVIGQDMPTETDLGTYSHLYIVTE